VYVYLGVAKPTTPNLAEPYYMTPPIQ
jgi:hypothetical protein